MNRTLSCIFISELLVAAGGGVATAIFVIPYGIALRGKFSVGGEWLIIILATCAAYRYYHRWIFKLLEEGNLRKQSQRKEVRRRMEGIKKYAEQEVGAITDDEYMAAYPYAKRKLLDINARFGTNHGDRYLALLVAETVSANRFSRYCERIHEQRQRERKPTLSGNSTNSHAFTIPHINENVNPFPQIYNDWSN